VAEPHGPSILDEAMTDQEQVIAGIGQKVQELSSGAMQLMMMQAYGAAGRSQQLEQAASGAHQDNLEQIRAQRERDVPLMRRVWDDRWWTRATPQEIRRVWQTANGWAANGDPMAMRAQERMREQFRDRYGLELPTTPVSSRRMAELLAGNTAGQENRGHTVRYDIRDKEASAGASASHGEFTLDSGAPLRLRRDQLLSEDRGGEVQEHAAELAEIEHQLGNVQRRLDEMAAGLRGEDHLLRDQARIVRADLTPEWWKTATPEEVAGLWRQVDGWLDGQIKADFQAELQGRIRERYGVGVRPGDSFAKVSGDIHGSLAAQNGKQALRFRVEDPQHRAYSDGVGYVPTDLSTRKLQELARQSLEDFAGIKAAHEHGLRVQVFDLQGTLLAADGPRQQQLIESARQEFADAMERGRAAWNASREAAIIGGARADNLRQVDIQRVWDHNWWNRVDAGEIGRAWETAATLARGGDAMAALARDQIRFQLLTRYGIEMPESERQVTYEIHREGWRGALRERVDAGRLTLDVGDTRPLSVVAADRLADYQRLNEGRYVIVASDQNDPAHANQTELTSSQAAERRRGYYEKLQVNLREEQAALKNRLDELVAQDPQVAPAQGRHGGMSPELHARHVAEVDQQLADVRLRLDKVEALFTLGDPALVDRAPNLRAAMTEEWWRSAKPEQVSAVWAEAGAMPDSVARSRFVAEIKGEIQQRYGVGVWDGASVGEVSGDIHRALAAQNGKQALRYHIQSAEGFGAVELGIAYVPRDLGLEEFAQRRLAAAVGGDLDAARRRGLTIQVSDAGWHPGHGWSTEYNADGRRIGGLRDGGPEPGRHQIGGEVGADLSAVSSWDIALKMGEHGGAALGTVAMQLATTDLSKVDAKGIGKLLDSLGEGLQDLPRGSEAQKLRNLARELTGRKLKGLPENLRKDLVRKSADRVRRKSRVPRPKSRAKGNAAGRPGRTGSGVNTAADVSSAAMPRPVSQVRRASGVPSAPRANPAPAGAKRPNPPGFQIGG
jgi:hypothetical protein